jgi:2-keto-4-pentenoate hydratase/2-oxohepta-3-ene-1,7-dioic acid hydratase in catechol pathway
MTAVDSPFVGGRASDLDDLEPKTSLDLDAPFEWLPPATPSKIVCIGRNFRSHADELDNPVPEEPLIFLKPPSALLAHEGTIALPEVSETIHHEAELALVVGDRLFDAEPDRAERAIWGYTCANDVTARDLQDRDKTFTRAKGFDTFCPIGPTIVPADRFDPTQGRIRARVGDETRQSADLDQMLVSVPELLSFVSGVMTLEPGDVVLTGTPDGVGPIEEGDRVAIDIEGLETLTNDVILRSPS